MSIEENVNGRNEKTEAVAGATKESREAASVEVASTVLGKFKDVDALVKAYESLQAEFTRRSQRLRALESEREYSQRQGASSGAEKLRKAARLRREATKKFDEFVTENCSATKGEIELAQRNAAAEEGEADGDVAEKANEKLGLEVALDELEDWKDARKGGEGEDVNEAYSSAKERLVEERVEGVARGEALTQSPRTENGGEGVEASADGYGGRLSSAAKNEDAPVSSEALYERASSNEEVRLRIVGEYLASLGKAGVPLTGGGLGVAVTPPLRARTVGQAGDMALLYFRKPTVD